MNPVYLIGGVIGIGMIFFILVWFCAIVNIAQTRLRDTILSLKSSQLKGRARFDEIQTKFESWRRIGQILFYYFVLIAFFFDGAGSRITIWFFNNILVQTKKD